MTHLTLTWMKLRPQPFKETGCKRVTSAPVYHTILLGLPPRSRGRCAQWFPDPGNLWPGEAGLASVAA